METGWGGSPPQLPFNFVISSRLMKTQSPLTPKLAIWGICLIVLCWIAATFLFEFHLGWPAGSIQWAKRLVGWSVEFLLIRTFVLGIRRYYTSPQL
jgi:hypothetical protein